MNELASNLFSTPPGDKRGAGARAEIVAYFAASLVALLVDLGVFTTALRFLEIPWAWAAVFGFLTGAVTAYLLSVTWVFSKRRMQYRPHCECFLFIGIGIVGLAVTQLVLWLGIDRVNAQPEFVKLAASGATFVFNYVVRKTALFQQMGA